MQRKITDETKTDTGNDDTAAAPLAFPDADSEQLDAPGPVQLRGIRLIRNLMGLALVLIAVLALARLYFYASSEGMIVARSIILRTPINGIVQKLKLDAGDFVEHGELIATVRNNRVDVAKREEIRVQLSASEARLAAVREQIRDKTRDRDRQEVELDRQRVFERTNLTRSLQEAQAQLAALVAFRARRETEYRATVAMEQKQLVARLDLERVRSEWAASTEAVEAQSAVVGRVKNRLQALDAGLFIDSAVPVQEPRIDDLNTRLRDLKVAEEEALQNIRSLTSALSAETQSVSKVEEVVIESPAQGEMWQRKAANGQHLVAGAELVEIIDKSSIHVVTTFPQRYLPDIAVGDAARIWPSGHRNPIHATVLRIGAVTAGQDQIVPPQQWSDEDSTMRVLLSIDDADKSHVWVGQHARVEISSSRSPAWMNALIEGFAHLLHTW